MALGPWVWVNLQSATLSLLQLMWNLAITTKTANVVKMVQKAMTAGPRLTGLSKLGTTPSGGVAAGIVQRSTPGGIEAIVRFGGGRSKSGENKGRSKHRSDVGAISSNAHVMHMAYVSSICWAFLTSKLRIPEGREPHLPAWPRAVLQFTCEWFMYATSCKK